MDNNKNPRTSQGMVCVMCHRPRALVMTYTSYTDATVETEGYCVECFGLYLNARAGLTLREALK